MATAKKTSVLAFFVAVLWVAALWPIPASFAIPPAESTLYTATVDVPMDLDAQQIVLRARDFAKAGAYDRACELLHEMITSDRSADTVFSEDARLYVPLRDRCHEIVRELPPDGLRLYRTAVDPAARRLLDEALEEGDHVKLARVADLYVCSSVGDEALDRLAAIRLDRGDLVGARAAWERLLNICPADERPDRDHVRLKMAAVESLLGRAVPATKSLRGIRREEDGPTVRLGGRELQLAKVTSRHLPGALRPSGAPPARDVRLGNLKLVWRRDGFRVVRPTPASAQARRGYAGQGRFLALPTARAIHIDGRLYAKDYNRLWVFDPRSPSRTFWSTAVQNLGRPVAESTGRLNDMPHFNAAWVDHGAQSVSVGEGVVLVTERNGFRAQLRGPGQLEDLPNDLAAYSALTGKRLWSTVDLGAPVPLAHFLTTPTIRDGRAYVPLTGEGGTFHVAAYRTADGSVVWTRKVGMTLLRGVLRGARNDASRIVLDDDSAYVLTNAGLAARLDLLDGRIRWIARTPKTHQDLVRAPGKSPDQEFAPSDPVLAKGMLVLAPSDSQYVVCLDAATGREVWKDAVQPGTTHLVGVSGDRVILGGQRLVCYELKPRSNRPRVLWHRDIAAPSGRACLHGGSVYVASGKTIRRFSVLGPGRDGSVVARPREPVGNLSPMPHGLVASNEKGIQVYADVRAQYSLLTRGVESAPRDLTRRLDRARLGAAAGGAWEDTAVEDLETVLRCLEEGEESRTSEELGVEVRGLLLDILIRRAGAGNEAATKRAGEVAKTLGERIRVALARADACSTSGDALGAVRALHAVLPEARECVVGSGGTTRDAESAIRERLLPLRRDPAVRVWSDERADEAGLSGNQLVDAFPTASAAPGALLAIAREVLAKDPVRAHDLALRVRRDYPSTPEAAEGLRIAEQALAARGLAREAPRSSRTPELRFPMRHLVEIGVQNAVAPRVGGDLRRAAASTIMLAVPGDDERVLEGRSAAMGNLLWRVRFPLDGRATPEHVATSPHLLHLTTGRLVLGTPHGFHWFSVGIGAGVGNLIATQPLPDKIGLLTTKRRRVMAGNTPLVGSGGSDAPDLLVSRGLAVAVGREAEEAYRLGPDDVRPRRIERVWSREVSGERVGATLVVEDRLVVTRKSPSRVTVTRIDTGRVATTVDLGAELPAGPAVAGPDGDLYVATMAGEVSRYDLLTGRWEWSFRLDQEAAGILHVDDERVVVLGRDGRATAVSGRDGTADWTTRIVGAGAFVIDAVATKGKLVVWTGVSSGSMPGSNRAVRLLRVFASMSAQAFDLTTGDAAWAPLPLQGGSRIPGRALLVGDIVFLATCMIGRDARIEALRVEEGKLETPLVVPLASRRGTVIWRPELTRQGDHLLLRTPRGVLVFGRGAKSEGVRTD